MIRLFVGLALPQAQRDQLGRMAHGLSDARWVAPDNLHITLRFIGEVDEDRAEDIAQALDTVRVEPFAVTIAGLGTFGHPAHALWAGVTDTPPGALAHLAGVVESVCVREGLEPEHRKFTPHVTLARFRKGHAARLRQYIESYGDVALEPFHVTGFTLFQSHLSHTGAHYEALVEYGFSGL